MLGPCQPLRAQPPSCCVGVRKKDEPLAGLESGGFAVTSALRCCLRLCWDQTTKPRSIVPSTSQPKPAQVLGKPVKSATSSGLNPSLKPAVLTPRGGLHKPPSYRPHPAPAIAERGGDSVPWSRPRGTAEETRVPAAVTCARPWQLARLSCCFAAPSNVRKCLLF